MDIGKIAYRVSSALRHSISAKGAHTIHSPFLFDFYNNVVKKDANNNDYYFAENYRYDLIDSETTFRNNKNEEEELWGEIETSSVSEKTGRFLYRLIKKFSPHTVLELGTNAGISTLYMALALRGKDNINFSTIEKNTSLSALASENYKNKRIMYTAMPEVNFVNGDFYDKLPEVLSETQKLDFVFIDGDHTKSGLLNYFYQCVGKAGENSVFVLNDIHWSSEIYEAWQQIISYKNVSLALDMLQLGVVFFNPDLSRQDFKIKWG